MTKQIALRLPDDLVHFLDDLVATGAAASRADVVTRALLRERRRAAVERDVQLLIKHGEDEDLEAMVAWTSRQPLDLD
ncbi:MAG: antitoxin [Mycobacteriales bacterium]